MQDNPYSAFFRLIRKDAAEHATPPWRIGTVRQVAPLVVEVAGQSLYGGDLLVNPMLLEHGRDLNFTGLTGSLSGSPQGLSVSDGSLAGAARLGGTLAPGDRVVLLQQSDEEPLVVLSKVVSP